ncbi:MAG: AAC(3) family N-acetyltransferase [Bacteroidia bacterium]|nr:AAC(3) family N-acetyltransferase [Bacteroidia bacterium]
MNISGWKNRLKSFGAIYAFYRFLKSIVRQFRRWIWSLQYGKLTKQDLVHFFSEIGMKAGDVWMVHSSLNAMGFVEGGAGTVVDAILELLGPEGTLVMPSFPAVGKNADYVKTHRVFDVQKTPSAMGVITETFRKMPGAARSWHLTDSVCAFGKHARYLTENHHECLRPHEEGSPFERFVRLEGKILLIGVHLDTLTLLHVSEDAIPGFRYPVYLQEPAEYEIITPDGKKIKSKTMVHNPDVSRQRKCEGLWKHFIREGFAFEKKFKGCAYRIIDAKSMTQWLIKAYHEKGITMYTPDGLND